MFGGGFSGSNSSSMQNTAATTAGNTSGTVFNFGPGATSGGALNQTTLIIVGVVVLAAVYFMRKR